MSKSELLKKLQIIRHPVSWKAQTMASPEPVYKKWSFQTIEDGRVYSCQYEEKQFKVSEYYHGNVSILNTFICYVLKTLSS